MDRARYSAIAHTGLPYAAPLPTEAFERIVARLDLPPDARVLDLGCGKGTLSARIAETWGAHCVGIDRVPQIPPRPARGSLEIRAGALGGPLPGGPWDLVVNIGAMPPARQAEAIGGWRRLLAPGGRLLIGDGYWKRAPDAGYLEALGATPEELPDLAGLYALGDVAYAEISRDEDFEAYEVAYRDNVERWVAAHPDDPDAAAMAERARWWWGVYARWGRDTLGFGVVLLAG